MATGTVWVVGGLAGFRPAPLILAKAKPHPAYTYDAYLRGMAIVIQPTEVDAEQLAAVKALLEAGGGDGQGLPEAARQLLEGLVSGVEEGQTLTVIAGEQLLKTTEITKLLGVSRPYVSGLISRGVLPSEKVGSHHRVALRHVAEYQRRGGGAGADAGDHVRRPTPRRMDRARRPRKAFLDTNVLFGAI